jgi:hypothetical protein
MVNDENVAALPTVLQAIAGMDAGNSEALQTIREGDSGAEVATGPPATVHQAF